MSSTWLALLLATLACSAGCLDAPSIEEPEAKPSITGLVLDSLLLPMDATVTVLETGNTTSPDDDGRYEFEIPPGNYTLQATAPGFLSQSRHVALTVSGQEVWVNFTLQRLAPEGYERVHQFSGYIECSAFAKAGHSHGSGEPSDNPTDCGAYQTTQSIWDVSIEPGADAIVVEVAWEKQSELATHLLVVLYDVTDGEEYMTFQEGGSPIKVPVGSIEAQTRFAEGGTLRVDVQIGGSDQDVVVGAAVQQPFEAFATVFYGHVAPADYSILGA